MRIKEVARLSKTKLQSYKLKTVFLVVPLTLLIATGVILTSSAANVEKAINQSVFGTIEEQGRLIKVDKQADSQSSVSVGGGGGARSFRIGEADEFKESDLSKITSLDGVASADLLNSVPIGAVKSSTIVEGSTIELSQFTSLASDVAAQFTDTDFTWKEGDPIPVILSSNQLTERYEDWQGKDEITQEFGRPSAGTIRSQSFNAGPIKTKQVSVNAADLIGKEFTGTIGSLNALSTFTTEPTDAGIAFKKKSAETLASEEQARNAAISPYWNYDTLRSGFTQTFKIVGVLDSENQQTNYIPSAAAEKLMSNLIQAQLSARTATAIPSSTLNQTFTGLSYDGLTLKGGLSFGGQPIRIGVGRIGGASGAVSNTTVNESQSYSIPGLVISTERGSADANNPFDTGTVTGVSTDTAVYQKAARSSATILVRTTSIDTRAHVISQLNDSGFAVRDTLKLGVITDLKDRLALMNTVFSLIFIVLVGVVLSIALSRFIADSRREIAVFRALGARKGQIRQLFLGQAMLASGLAGVIGLATGALGTLLISIPLAGWFSNAVESSLKASFPTIQTAEPTVFRAISWQGVGLYAGLLILVTIITTLILSNTATRVKPAEALKGE